jgi:hypothetical protein
MLLHPGKNTWGKFPGSHLRSGGGFLLSGSCSLSLYSAVLCSAISVRLDCFIRAGIPSTVIAGFSSSTLVCCTQPMCTTTPLPTRKPKVVWRTRGIRTRPYYFHASVSLSLLLVTLSHPISPSHCIAPARTHRTPVCACTCRLTGAHAYGETVRAVERDGERGEMEVEERERRVGGPSNANG